MFASPKAQRRSVSFGELCTPPTRTGISVTEQTAMGITALKCGVQVISEAVGSLPLILYHRGDNGHRSRADNHPLYPILRDSPNPETTAPVFRESLMFSALLHGNAYAEIVRDGAGRPVELWAIPPTQMRVDRDPQGQLRYVVQGGQPLNPEDVIHVPGLQDGCGIGYSLLKVARETLGYTMAVTRFGSSWFANAARPSGVLETAGQLSDPGRANLAQSWKQLHSGPDNAGAIAVLEEGLQFKPIFATNEQSQYVEVMSHLVGEVARLLNISPAKLHDLKGTSQYGTYEAIEAAFMTTTVRPWLVKIEAEFNRKLLSEAERGQFYCEHLVDSFLRAEPANRYAIYATAISSGVMTAEEVRQRENMPPKVEDVLTPADGAVQDTALNGAQITSLLLVTDKVASGAYPAEAGIAIIQASFPSIDESLIRQFVSSLVKAPKPPEEPSGETATNIAV